MTAKLIAPTEAIEVKQLCCLIYGQPGARKTSLAQTAEEPITLAFDPGIYRAYGRKTSAIFESWEDVTSFDLAPYKTVVVDTIGMCLEKLATAIIADNAKNGNRLGGLSLAGYGVLKNRFASWVSSIRERGQSIVFTSHEREEKNGDELYACPDIVGSNYNTIMNVADMVGYLHFQGGHRVLDFQPTDRWMAKTPPCNWPQLRLPDFENEPDYLARLIAGAKASMGRISARSAQITEAIDNWQRWLATTPTLDQFNEYLPELAKIIDPAAKGQAKHLCSLYAKQKGWHLPNGQAKFVGGAA